MCIRDRYRTLPAANGVVRCATIGACSEHALLAAGAQHWTGVSRPHLHYGNRGRLQNVSPPSVLLELSGIFFTIHRRHRRKKLWTRILKFEFCDFWEFFEIFKKVSRGPSAAIWSIMVAAKLDHSRVLVTKFYQNRSMLKGRSAGQRHTDRQTRLKIRALQVLQSGQQYFATAPVGEVKKQCKQNIMRTVQNRNQTSV